MNSEKIAGKIWALLKPKPEPLNEDLMSACGGSVDDAYSIGEQDGWVNGWNDAVRSITNLIEKEGE